MATAARETDLPPEVLDIANPELWGDHDRLLPYFRQLREAGPVHYCPDSIYGPYWSVVSAREIMEVEGNPDIYSSSWEKGGISIGGGREDVPPERMLPMFIAMDAPQHTGQRRTVAPAFTPSEMVRQEPNIRARTAEILDSLPVNEEFNWVERVSVPLTSAMLATLFDFPWEDRHLLPKWSDVITDMQSFEDAEVSDQNWAEMQNMAAYFGKLWMERVNKEPTPDLISMMIHSDATNHMEPREFLGNMALMTVAGNDTTRNTMSAAIVAQNLYPENWAKMMADPKLLKNGVSELIRWQAPVGHMRRTVTKDTELGGKTIREGEKVVVWYLSASRDEDVYPDGDVFDPARENARRHLSFGFGVHRCVGYRLAELQLQILLEEMQKRDMQVKLVGDIERIYGCFINGYTNLPVTMTRN